MRDRWREIEQVIEVIAGLLSFRAGLQDQRLLAVLLDLFFRE